MTFLDEYLPLREKYDALIQSRIDRINAGETNEQLAVGGIEFREQEAELVYQISLVKERYGIFVGDRMLKPRKTRMRDVEQKIQEEQKEGVQQ